MTGAPPPPPLIHSGTCRCGNSGAGFNRLPMPHCQDPQAKKAAKPYSVLFVDVWTQNYQNYSTKGEISYAENEFKTNKVLNLIRYYMSHFISLQHITFLFAFRRVSINTYTARAETHLSAVYPRSPFQSVSCS